ncbi:hypothetical protein GXW82_39225 [Streptacidiphilus sp. 4-A2]|nr:hypothetical protein [Streptacidiphilus sp. 4-A2]
MTSGVTSEEASGEAKPARAARPSPRYQLPADTRSFTGRGQEIEHLLALARDEPDAAGGGTVVISAIDGMGGVGKSALAVHAAHLLREQYPDGQLFVDLHGHTKGMEPLTADSALNRLLSSLGVPPQLIPRDLGERAAFYRDRLADTRTLIVLDNAQSAAQVRPLLPGTAGCLVLVTSRKRLAGLDDAYSVALGTLPVAEAVALLRKVATPERVAADHPALDELAALCGCLPLAIRIVAARLRHHPSLRVEDVIDQLRDEGARFEHLADEDRSLTAVFDLSYSALPAAEQDLFRDLGRVPGADFDTGAVARLIDADRRTADRLLTTLVDHNLLIQHAPDRYRLHDLVRLFARALGEEDPAAEAESAVERLLDHYQHIGQEADHRLARSRRPGRPGAATPPAPAQRFDRVSALAWLHANGRT